MRAIYIVLLASLLFSFWKALAKLRRRHTALTPILGWVVGLGFFILAPFTFIVLNGGYEFPNFFDMSDRYSTVDLSSAGYVIPFIVIWLSLLFSFMTVILCVPGVNLRQQLPEIDIDERRLRRVIFITAGLALLDYSMTIWLAGGIEAYLISNWYIRGTEFGLRFGEGYTLYSWLSQTNQLIFTAAAALHAHFGIKHRKMNWRLFALVVLLFLLHIAIQGDRIFFALYLLSIMASSWLYGRKKLIAVLLMIAPALALIFSAWAYFRNDPVKIGENISVYAEQDLGNRAALYFIDAFEGSDTILLFHVIKDFGSKFDYLYGISYAKVLFFMVPRRLFPEKPRAFAVQLATLYEPGATTSFAATQLGELYANFGVLSVVLLPFITLLILQLSDRLLQKIEKHMFLSALLFLLSVWSVRATFEESLILFLLAMFLIRGLRLAQGLCYTGPPIEALATAS
jgi:oligosaccharide repeat unit polymerase